MSLLRRRDALRILGVAALPLAGCLGNPAVQTLAPGETYETDDGREISIDKLAVHRSVVTVTQVSSTHYYKRVTNAGNGQYLTFQVEVDGFDLETEESELYDEPIDVPLVVDIDGERYGDPIPVGRDGDPYRDRVAIKIPIVNGDEAGVV